jgi:hypothetical protein
LPLAFIISWYHVPIANITNIKKLAGYAIMICGYCGAVKQEALDSIPLYATYDGGMTETCYGSNMGEGEEELLRLRIINC